MVYPRPASGSGPLSGSAAKAQPERLESWKEIAAYLKRDARTLRRWEAGEGLPVRRLGHHKGASVYALRHELDDWLEKRTERGNGAPDSAHPRLLPWALLPAALTLAFALWWLNPLPPPRLENIVPITHSGNLDYIARPATYGQRIYYLARAGDHWDSLVTSFQGGSAPAALMPAALVTAGVRNLRVFDVSSRGVVLLGTFTQRGEVMPLWTQRATGGAAMRVGTLRAQEAVWSPDGEAIIYSRGGSTLWKAAADGSGARPWLRVPGLVSWIAFSPGGRRLRFSVVDLIKGQETIWEATAAGGSLHRVLPHWRESTGECCGAWTPDGRYYLFTSGDGMLWALRDHGGWRHAPRGPFQLSFGPIHFSGAVMAAGSAGVRLATYGEVGSEELNRWDAAGREFSPLLPGLHPLDVVYSRDGRWLVYDDALDRSLWRAQPDGSARAELTPPGLGALFPRLSPDGATVLFRMQPPGQPVTVATVPLEGGSVRAVLPGALSAHDPDWSPDGRQVVLVNAPGPAAIADQDQLLYVVSLATGKAVEIPGSAGLAAPRWSPDGRWIAAVRYDQRAIKLLDRRSGRWRVIARGNAFGMPVWSEHGRGLYYQDLLAPGEPLYRWDLASGRQRTIMDFAAQLRAGIRRCAFRGLAPGNVPLISFNRGSGDLFAGDLK